MKLRKNKVLSVVLVLMVFLSCFSFNAFAATFTKTVTVYDVITCTAPYSVLDNSINRTISSAPATKAYNQDGFTGTLNKSTSSVGPKYDTGIKIPGETTYKTLWRCEVTIAYTGVVSKYIAPKRVYTSAVTTVYAPMSYINTRVSNALATLPTMNYDDGQFKGVLQAYSASAGSIINTYQNCGGATGDYLCKCDITYSYSGMVEAYKP